MDEWSKRFVARRVSDRSEIVVFAHIDRSAVVGGYRSDFKCGDVVFSNVVDLTAVGERARLRYRELLDVACLMRHNIDGESLVYLDHPDLDPATELVNAENDFRKKLGSLSGPIRNGSFSHSRRDDPLPQTVEVTK